MKSRFTKHLSDYPHVLRAFQEIDIDNRGHVEVYGENGIPKKFIGKLEICETVLASIVNLRLGEVIILTLWLGTSYEGDAATIKLNEATGYEDYRDDESVFDMVVNPINDSAPLLLQGAGINAKDIKTTLGVLNSYFEGALSTHFNDLKSRRW